VTTQPVDTSSAGLLSANAAGNSPLDKNAFLKLLIAQMSNQDPLKPADDTAFVSQLAQFSSLEQMQNMNTNMSSMVNNQTITQSTSFIGKAVQWTDSTSGKSMVGQVKSVTFENNQATLVVRATVSGTDKSGNPTETVTDLDVPLSSVQNVFDAEDTAGISSALGWIGKNVTGTDLATNGSITGRVTGLEYYNGVTVLDIDLNGATSRVALNSVQSVSD
jgi:flagellar basal-body rod modification protein FlgD